MKQSAPATQRNREPIAEKLALELPKRGLLLEVASGTGEHAFHLAGRFPALTWQPSDPDETALASISAWRDDYSGENIASPIMLDASSQSWPVERADAIFCCNMVHISPLAAVRGLFAGAGRLLSKGAPLILYGPYEEDGVETAASNLQFEQWLKDKNPEFGLRNTRWVDQLAAANGLSRTARYAMPANNLILVFRKD